jgi:2-(1,2-epoxy-1,2-dihydrophenyl)acetyl-CoA isomerase
MRAGGAAMTQAAPQVLFEKHGRVGLLTLNRPERLNAWSAEMQGLIREHVSECNADPGIGAIVITGAGRGFCAGADLRRERSAEGEAPARPREQENLVAFLQGAKPLIAAINGPAIGVGFTLTLNCDLRIASENARVSMRFVRVGLTPELASSFLLPQVAGLANAAEMMLTGRILDAQAALQMGVVNRVVAPEELIPTALALGEEIAFNPSTHVRWAKRLLYANAANDNLRSVLQSEDEIFGQAARSPAFAEAGRAFAEKREPNYHP